MDIGVLPPQSLYNAEKDITDGWSWKINYTYSYLTDLFMLIYPFLSISEHYIIHLLIQFQLVHQDNLENQMNDCS